MQTVSFLVVIAVFASLLIGAAIEPAEAAQKKPTLDAAARRSAIDGVLRCLNEGYVFPDVARKMEEAVRKREAAKEYERIEDGNELADVLTRDLRAVSNDLHIGVGYSPAVLPPENVFSLFAPLPPLPDGMRRKLEQENFGLAKLDILDGNIGYLRFHYFADPSVAADTYAAAMTYVAHTDALILDLRASNGSMSPDALPMLCTYFFEGPTHLNDIYWRPEDRTRQFWTWAHVPGKRYLNKPIYVLTSGKTFSGAEELAYDLQNLKRATLIGETTGGGANPGGSRRADDHFQVWVPSGRAINPITKTNWEGVGVTPDVAVPAARALHAAHLTALKQLEGAAADAGQKGLLTRTIADLERNPPRFKKVPFALKGFPEARQVTIAGTFNFWGTRSNPLTRRGDAWVGEVEAEPGRHEYKFVVDGRWIADPANPVTETDDPNGNSVRVVE